MVEQMPHVPNKAPVGDVYQSRFYQYGTEVQLPGDPETREDFARAQSYLETITHHLVEFGPVWEKQPKAVTYELDFHNAWHKHEVEQEQRRGEHQAAYHEVTLLQLRALSKRRALALEETGQEATSDFQVVQHIDGLIEQALLEQQAIEALMAASAPKSAPYSESSSHDVPF